MEEGVRGNAPHGDTNVVENDTEQRHGETVGGDSYVIHKEHLFVGGLRVDVREINVVS